MSRPELLSIAGPQDMALCHAAFKELVLDRCPIVDPRGITINISPADCEHVCVREEARKKRARMVTGGPAIRDEFVAVRAAHISWIHQALTDPVEIVRSKKRGQERNELYLLCFPKDNPYTPFERFMVAVKPDTRTTRLFASAYPIELDEWKDMRRVDNRNRLYQRKPRRY